MRISDWSSDVCSSDLPFVARDEGMPLVRLLEQGHRAIAVLHIGRMDQYDQGATIGIDHCMAFASHGLLACVVTTRYACFDGLHALAVDDCRGWCWFSPCPDAIDPKEMMIAAFEYPIVAQGDRKSTRLNYSH